MIFYDVSTNNEQSIATIMNDYFTTISIALKLANKIKNKFKPTPSTSSPSPFNFEFEETDESLLFQELKKLKTNKAIGFDRISARLLKDSVYTIIPMGYINYGLTKIVKLSLHSSTFLDIWKKWKVIPLFKSGDPTLQNNPKQSNFRSKLSTTAALAQFTDKF